jgi:hypothetical protein
MATTLRERFPEHVEITLFTPAEERSNGADWYWRFERGDCAVHARVQAKRVQRTEFGQPDSAGRVDIDLPQLTQLVEGAESASQQLPALQAWLATYAQFDATPPCGKGNLNSCQRHNHEGHCADHSPSLWIAQANEVLGLNVTRAQVRQIVERSVRLDCILPCIDGPNVQEGPARKGFTLNAGLLPYQECVARIQSDTALLAQFWGAMRIFV